MITYNEPQTKWQPDARTYLFLIFTTAITTIFIASNTAITILFAAEMIVMALSGNLWKIPKYIAVFTVLSIFILGIEYLIKNTGMGYALFSTSILFVYGRKMIIPFLFASSLSSMHTGALLKAINEMHLPKHVGIIVAVILRFFPTFSYEYKKIREAQKFRGIGSSFWNGLAHPLDFVEMVLIPLTNRTMKISEELSASIMVRGVRLTPSPMSCLFNVRFTKKDALCCFCMLMVCSIVIFLEGVLWG